MASNVITINTSLVCNNGNFQFSRAKAKQADQTIAAGGNPGTVLVGTSEAAIGFGNITTLGIAWIENLDSTNFVELGPESGGAMVPCLKLLPGEGYCVRLKPGVTWRAKADTASVRIYFAVLEN